MQAPADNNLNTDSDSVVHFADIIRFITESWQKLFGAALAGAFLGFGSWYLIAPYQSTIYLRNSEALEVTFVKSLQVTLPNLALEMLEKKQLPEGQTNLYKSFSNPEFWKKAVTMVNSLSKVEIKDLGVDFKDINKIPLFLRIQETGASRDSAKENINAVLQFIRQGGAYISIRDLFDAQKSLYIAANANLDSKINLILVNLEYQRARLIGLESLSKRFPVESRQSFQAIDIKESGAKFLPVNTQIIAVNSDINSNLEKLSRLRDQQTQQVQIEHWLKIADPLIGQNYNGLELIKQLLVIEEKLRSELKSAEPRDMTFINDLRNNLLLNDARFRLGLVQNSDPTITKPGMLKLTAGGLIVAFFLTLLALLSRRIWAKTKSVA